MNRPYYVFSPEYETHSACWDPPEPPEYGCEVYQVEAESKRAAIIAGVRIALKTDPDGSWAGVNRQDCISPFAGYKAELAVCGHGNPHFLIVNGKPVALRCWACDALSERACEEEVARLNA
ncbi:MAG TPA: hypothetical protein VJT67_07265 [Longimicrobiaceae bacterium]|nr:hypothetical protein [Longimicrobiaceae bacterium]